MLSLMSSVNTTTTQANEREVRLREAREKRLTTTEEALVCKKCEEKLLVLESDDQKGEAERVKKEEVPTEEEEEGETETMKCDICRKDFKRQVEQPEIKIEADEIKVEETKPVKKVEIKEPEKTVVEVTEKVDKPAGKAVEPVKKENDFFCDKMPQSTMKEAFAWRQLPKQERFDFIK